MASSRDKKLTALVVDDEPAIVDFVSQMLSIVGFDVIKATSVKDALAAVEGIDLGRPELAVLDIAIDKDSGIVLAQTLLKTRPRTAILFISGFINELILFDSLPAGTRAAFLQKVFTFEELRNAVTNLMADRGKKGTPSAGKPGPIKA